jgi:long-chain acyl-CoA synthetase
MTIIPQLVQNFLEDSAHLYPDKVALICDDKHLSYADIDASANQIAHAILDGGIGHGDRVAIFLPNSIESVIGIFGILKSGATFVVINATTKLEKLVNILNNCQVAGLLLDIRKNDLTPAILKACSSLKLIIYAHSDDKLKNLSKYSAVNILDIDTIGRSYPTHRPPVKNIDLDLACLIYTSGSTGEPKGVMCDHSNVTFVASSITQYLENNDKDIIIDVLPLSFDYGLYQLLMVFKFGGTLVLERSFAYPTEILKRIEHEKVTGFPGVPMIFSILLRMNLTSYDFTNLRYITNTAAALPPSQIQQLKSKFPHAKIYSMYGLTETKRALYLPPEQLDVRPTSVGIPIPGTEAWIEDGDGHRVACGVAGELVIRGRHVMRGYWGDEAVSAERFRPGSFPGERICYTGDNFQMDEDGYFYFLGRKDEIYKCRGEKVSPLEIENILYRLNGIVEAAVIGTKDPILGEVGKAFIVSNNPTLTKAAVLAHCHQNLEDFMVPQYVEFLDEFPKTSSGKIDKRKLAERELRYDPKMIGK